MAVAYMTRDLRGRPVISVANGKVLARLQDVLVAPNMRQVAAAVICGNDVFHSQIRAIPGSEIHIWGQDALLTDQHDLEDRSRELEGIADWPSVSGQLRGRRVVATDGTHIGTLYDLIIDQRGQIVGYELSEVLVDGPIAYSRQVPAEAHCLLEPDALIVDVSRIE